LPWIDFLDIIRDFEALRSRFGIRTQYSDPAGERIRQWVAEQRFLDERAHLGFDKENFNRDAVLAALNASTWDLEKRLPTREQIRDIAFLEASQHGAVFSVPGAGKTSVALANDCLLRVQERDCRMLVVAPRNAFPAWDEALHDCLRVPPITSFIRLTGGAAQIHQLLQLNPEYAIISYDQARIVNEQLKTYLRRNKIHLVLDESHRIKSGGGRNSQSILELAPFAHRRNILSGTPMPNSKNDLIQQFLFLYPGSNLGRRIDDLENPGPVVRPFYARTRYSELGVPRPIPIYESVGMSDVQLALYALLRDELLKQIHLSVRDNNQVRNSALRLIRVAIDPAAAALALLARDDLREGVLQDVCIEVARDEMSPRLERAVELTRLKVEDGRKVVLWVPFTATIEKMVAELAEYGARALYGATPSGDVDDEDTRESILAQFHDLDTAQVLVANPAAGGEGISLHRVCHTAIYLGRTYNAAHYMQSRDRICRLGMPEGVIPEITVIESRAPERLGSIDLSIRRRLDAKIEEMGVVLDDPDLVEIARESLDFDQELFDGLNFADLDDLIYELKGNLA
jgi:SNF2 family DNA or RNA helicase